MALSINVFEVLSIIGRNPLNVSFPIFVETGTNYGGTIFGVENIFDELYTIELKKEFYEYCKNKYTGNKINFILGDSSKVFVDLIPKLEKNTVFYLDAHWSAQNTAKGDKENPLLEELEQINKIKAHAIIIIDDYRLFGVNIKDCNWSDITEENILSKLDKDRIISKFVENDRLIIYLK